ncbi:MAG: DUF58 domain-containing protein [Candidatus Marinimicrobia bacterium]|nr:DUF58 domain-containing protein [Candidatus Neomarinimicrobiota bacterium]|tara:strand:- start:740 stop:1615 length:876 start_codon:yes stop_codon:yes gene_type:complete
MLPSEILKKVRLLEIQTRHLVNNVFGGEYHSAFKGMGMEFAEVREYQPGDDIRDIDWNVTARTGKPFIKKFDEERELSVMLMVDVSASGYFGSGENLKSDIMVELASILSFSAIKNNDKVGLILFSDQIEKFIPPNKGKSHVLRVIRELIYYKTEDKQTKISEALEYSLKALKRKSVIFLLSDFLDQNYEKSLKLMNQKHDLICIQITDPSEIEIPNLGLIKMHDVESGKTFWIDSSNKKVRNEMKTNFDIKSNLQTKLFKKNKIDHVLINTEKSYIEPLVEFFNKRISRF